MALELQSPWKEFLTDIDSALQESVSLHCIGGFVACVRYGLPRPTGDIDYISMQPLDCEAFLSEIAGPGSTLFKKHKLYLQRVGVTILPEEYQLRLEEIFPGQFRNVRLYVPDPYDLILSKVERNGPKDRYDVEFLAKTLSLDADVLRGRYFTEFRPNIFNEERHDLTIKLWVESYFQSSSSV
jgi:hypothetical protein